MCMCVCVRERACLCMTRVHATATPLGCQALRCLCLPPRHLGWARCPPPPSPASVFSFFFCKVDELYIARCAAAAVTELCQQRGKQNETKNETKRHPLTLLFNVFGSFCLFDCLFVCLFVDSRFVQRIENMFCHRCLFGFGTVWFRGGAGTLWFRLLWFLCVCVCVSVCVSECCMVCRGARARVVCAHFHVASGVALRGHVHGPVM